MNMTDRITIRDYWGEKNIIIAKSSRDKGLIAIGEELGREAVRWIHIKKEDLVRGLKELQEEEDNNTLSGKEADEFLMKMIETENSDFNYTCKCGHKKSAHLCKTRNCIITDCICKEFMRA